MTELLQIFGANPVFSTALAVVFGIGILEGVLSLLGFGLSNIFDSIFPDTDFDMNIEIDNPNTTFSELFSWLNKGNVPMIMIFLSFLSFFGIAGIFIQENIELLLGSKLTLWLAIPAAFVAALPFTRWTTVVISKIMPRDETTAVSRHTFIGEVATITGGIATIDRPTEAKYKDVYDQTHYIMVQPLRDGVSFSKGDKVLLMKQLENGVFETMRDPNSLLEEKVAD